MSRKTANKLMWATLAVFVMIAGLYGATVYDMELRVIHITGDWSRTLSGGEWKSSPANAIDTFTAADTFKTGWFYWNSNVMFVNGSIYSKGSGKDSVNFKFVLEGSYDGFTTISYTDTFSKVESVTVSTVVCTFTALPPDMKWRGTGYWRYDDTSGQVWLYGWAPEDGWITF